MPHTTHHKQLQRASEQAAVNIVRLKGRYNVCLSVCLSKPKHTHKKYTLAPKSCRPVCKYGCRRPRGGCMQHETSKTVEM